MILPGLHNCNKTPRVLAVFEKLGYRIAKKRGIHYILKRPGSPRLVVPRHREVKGLLLEELIRQAGVSEDEFKQLY